MERLEVDSYYALLRKVCKHIEEVFGRDGTEMHHEFRGVGRITPCTISQLHTDWLRRRGREQTLNNE